MRTISVLGSILLFLPLIVPSSAAARVWHVPADAPTIQAGIDSATAGDIIELACGTYYEADIVLKGGIVLRSETGSSDCVEINAQSLGRVFKCASVRPRTQLVGLGLRRGSSGTSGGSMYISDSDILLSYCELWDNKSDDYGGGIYCSIQSTLAIEHCSFHNNRSLNDMGGAVYCSGAALASICDSAFLSNRSAGSGAAVALEQGEASRMERCLFKGNWGCSRGAACWLHNQNITVLECDFVDNLCYPDIGSRGGALYIWEGAAVLERSVFLRNRAEEGGAIYLSYSPDTTIEHCTLAANEVGFSRVGGAIQCYGTPTITVNGSIIAFTNGGAAYWGPGTILFSCSDIFGNQEGDWIALISGQVDLRGNFSANPCFCDMAANNVQLCADSWCLPGHHPWGCSELVGAPGRGCSACDCNGPVGAVLRSWGSVKVMYQ